MKKLLLIGSLLLAGMPAIPTADAAQTSQYVCTKDSPCAYSGRLMGSGGKILDVSVHYSKEYDAFVAYFVVNGEEKYAFCVADGDGKWHFNWNGQTYSFNM